MKNTKHLLVCLSVLLLVVVEAQPEPQISNTTLPEIQLDKPRKRREHVAIADLPDMWRTLIKEATPQSRSKPLNSSQASLLQEKYIFSSTGARYDFLLGATDVQSAIGEFNFDGRGVFLGLRMSRTLFTGSTSFSFAGTYTLDSSGAGFLFYTSGQTQSIIAVNRGEAFFFVDVRSSNFREAGYARKL